MIKKLIFIFTLTLLFGCVPKNIPVTSLLTTDEILNSEYAYVLVAATSDASIWLHTSKRYDEKHSAFETFTAKSDPKKKGVPLYHLFKVLPGRYTIIDFYGGGTYLPKETKEINDGIKETNSSAGALTLEKGKITYVGVLMNYIFINEYYFKIENHEQEALKFLAEQYPNIQINDSTFTIYLATTGRMFK